VIFLNIAKMPKKPFAEVGASQTHIKYAKKKEKNRSFTQNRENPFFL
jgi:hypothetical protein